MNTKRLKIAASPLVLLILIAILGVSIYGSFLIAGFLVSGSFKNASVFLFPHPHENGFYGNGIQAYVLIGLTFLIFFGFILCINVLCIFIFKQKYSYEKPLIKSSSVSLVMLAAILIITLAQTVQHAKYFLNNYSRFNSLNVAEKKQYFMGFVYDYALSCRQYFKEGHQHGKLITDMDLSTNMGMTQQRRLAYYLYPIMIRSVGDIENPDYLIYFQKKNAATLVPKEYVVQLRINDDNLMAIRKDLL